MNSKKKNLIAVFIVAVLLVGTARVAYDSGRMAGAPQPESQTAQPSQTSPEIEQPRTDEAQPSFDEAQTWDGMTAAREYEYMGSGLAWQLSAEAQALMMQAFDDATARIDELVAKCDDPDEPDWELVRGEDGTAKMYHNGVRVALVTDVDDTLVDGAHYSADIVGRGGDMNNAAFARFLMSDECTALPGAVDFIRYCGECGVEVFYVTNRYDQGYKIGQSDSYSSYEESIKADGKGLYVDASGNEIGSTLYQIYGKSVYDISMESMQKLGFPIDEEHLIVNDNKLNGSSKEPARQAIINGSESYPNGQREDGNAAMTAETAGADEAATTSKTAAVATTRIKIEPHDLVMLMGDNLNDFSDDFCATGLDAVSRADAASQYADKWGSEWIVMPNAVYGDSMNYAVNYGMRALFDHYGYNYIEDAAK